MLMVVSAFGMAFTSIWAHKARAVLTTLGVVLGVSSVITLLAIGEGLRNDVKLLVTEFGTNTAFIIPGDFTALMGNPNAATANPTAFFSQDTLTMKDVKAVQIIDGVEHAVPMPLVPETVRVGTKGTGATIYGSSPEIQQVFTTVSLKEGRMFTNADQDRHTVVLGSQPTEQLFDGKSPIGEKVMIGRQEFTVIGQLNKPKGAATLTGSDFERIAIIPFDAASELLGKETVYMIGVKVAAGADVKAVADAIKNDLLTRHEDGDVSVLTSDDFLTLLDSLLDGVTAAVSAIAAISLIVGGIGIMNIMLVSVIERTKEIGIRKAVGATKGAILTQFLIEAIVISALGGALGLGLAVISAYIVDLKTSLVPVITPFMISLAIGVSAIVGIIFGLAPAIIAARKDPIEALRYE